MSLAVFAAALISAFLHTSWNAIAKKQKLPSDAILGIVVASAISAAAGVPFVPVPSAGSFAWMSGAVFCEVIYARALMEAYDRTSFATAYPATRGTVPPLLFLLGWLVLSESVGFAGACGLVMILVSIGLFTFDARRLGRRDLGGFTFAVLAGTALAGAWFCNTNGVRLSGHGMATAVDYGVWTSLFTSIALTVVAQWEGRKPLAVFVAHRSVSLAGAVLMTVSYFVGTWAYAQGPIGLVVALPRDQHLDRRHSRQDAPRRDAERPEMALHPARQRGSGDDLVAQ
jgi:drug/metabolite transporter (DMT)-like permease